MRKLLLLILLLTLLFDGLYAQRRNGIIGRRRESSGLFVFSFGPDYCYGDPDDSRPFLGPVFNQNLLKNLDFSLGYRQTYGSTFNQIPSTYGFKASINYGDVTGADIKNLTRGYSFNSRLIQFKIQAEYALYFGGGRYSRFKPNSVYGFLGTGIMQTESNLTNSTGYGNSKYLYKKSDLAPIIPYGVGFMHDFDNNFSLGAELNFEFTFSDYIDGFKPPYPESKSNDVLNGFSIVLSYKLF